jgi:hypothetical protein
MTKQTKQPEPRVEVDEAQLEQRRRDTERFIADPKNQAEMAAGKAALEAELAAAAAKQAQQSASEGAPLPPPPPTTWTPSAPTKPVWTTKAKRAHPPANPDDPFDVGRVEDVEIQLFDRPTGYHMLVVDLEGHTEEVWHGADRDGFGACLAMKSIRLDPDAPYEALHKLPRTHAVEERRQAALDYWYVRNTNRPGSGNDGVPRDRQVYRDRDLVTGQLAGTYSDGIATWS